MGSGESVVSSKRFTSLQGLRGVAAATVVVSHALGIFYVSGKDIGTILESIGPISHLTGILAAKAVWVFFVLSGFVLTHQLASKPSGTFRFLGSRLVRLYLPVWVAIALNLLVIALIQRSGKLIDFWIGAHPDSITPLGLVQEFLLIPDGYFLGPLWSLKWEVVFSLLVVLFWKAKVIARFPGSTVVASLVIATYGELIQNGWFKYIPMFVIGMALHSMLLKIKEKRITPRFEILALVAAGLLPTISYVATSEIFFGEALRYVVDVPTSLIAICVLFYVLIRGGFTSNVLETKPLQSLGDFSYSLYLFHLPLITFAFYFSNASVGWVSVAFVASFGFAYLAYRTIEIPSHNFSRFIRGGGKAAKPKSVEGLT
jgi:peptidoglycan/LPS O-acetylase OafA/YrhL